jgi:arsenical pump membrane protein
VTRSERLADDELLPIGDVDAARALRIGGPAVLVLLVGFVAGDAMRVPPWVVAAVVAAGLMAVTRCVPWRSLPWEAAVVGAGLAVLASSAAPRLGLDRVFTGAGVGAAARAGLAGIVGANVVNNLPALLVSLPYVDNTTMWALLAGVNLGPVLWASGSLAGLLWLDLVRREGLQVSFLDYTRVGVRVGLPAIVAASPWVLIVAAR